MISEETDPERADGQEERRGQSTGVPLFLHVLLPPSPTFAMPLSTKESADWTSPRRVQTGPALMIHVLGEEEEKDRAEREINH